MAKVIITIEDTEDEHIDINIKHSNIEIKEITPANLLGETLYKFCDVDQFVSMAFYSSKTITEKGN